MRTDLHDTNCVEGPVAVVKLGGEVVADRSALRAVLLEVSSLAAEGWRFVVCHGGGPQVSEMMERLGLDPVKVAGQRVTDEATLAVMASEIAGGVASQIVAMAWAVGVPSIGISAGVVHARRRPPVQLGDREIDYGWVGDVTAIVRAPLEACWACGCTPVVNPLGIDPTSGERYNINADTVASAVAVALGADHLVLFTTVPGVLANLDDPSSRIPRLDRETAERAIAAGTIVGGMIPKVQEALAAVAGSLLDGGFAVGSVHVLAPGPGALRAELQAPGSRGTVFVGVARP